MRSAVVLVALFVVGCGGYPSSAPKEAATAAPKLRNAHISSWTHDADGKPKDIILGSDDPDFPITEKPKRLVWMKIGNKAVLPDFYTYGKEAQAIRGDKLEAAWKARTPGVYKIDYSDPEVRSKVFKGYKVEVSGQ